MHELRAAFRALRTTPRVTAVAVLSLALGIGANTAIFSIVDTLLLRTLPVPQPDRLSVIAPNAEGTCCWTNPIWEQVRERKHELFDTAFAYSATRFDLAQGGETQFVEGLHVSGDFFRGLGVPAILGRVFTQADDRRGGGPEGPVAVISYRYWQRRFGGAADAIGKTLHVERVPFTIVGVTPPDFFGADVGDGFDVAVPIGTEPLMRGKESSLDHRSRWWLHIMVRLKDGQTLASAEQALRGVQPQIREATLPSAWLPGGQSTYLETPFLLRTAATGTSNLRRSDREPILTIMAVVGLVLLIACANIANLLLARAAARRHEFSLRLALGASRLRLIRQLLAESLLLSGAGALLGLAVAHLGASLLVRRLSTQANTVFLDLRLDWRVLAFTMGVAVATALLFGIVPALRASRAAPIAAIRERGRASAGERRLGLGNGLVAGQVALSLVLVVAAGLFMRTFASLANLNLGFDRDPILLVSLNVQRSGVAPEQRPALFERAAQAVAEAPGVGRAAASDMTPVSGSAWSSGVQIEGRPAMSWPENDSHKNALTPGWFATYGTRLVAGRDFDAHDQRSSLPVTIVNETFVRKFLSGAGSPLGQRVRHEGPAGEENPWREIVGVVADATYRNLRDAVPPTMYVPLTQKTIGGPWTNISARAAAGGSPMLVARGIADAIARVDRDIAITFTPLKQQVDAALVQERIVAMLSGFFGALALLLAGLGLYGVTAYAVNRRRSEIGIRMALGAEAGDVVRMVLGRVGRLVFAGAGLSLWASRFVEALLYGLKPRDVATLAGASCVLAAVSAVAGWLPAR